MSARDLGGAAGMTFVNSRNSFLQSAVQARYQLTLQMQQQRKLEEECKFAPDLSLTQRYNDRAQGDEYIVKRSYSQMSRNGGMAISASDKEAQEKVYNRNQKWNERKDQKIFAAQALKAEQKHKEETHSFKPEIKQMISESLIIKEHKLNRKTLQALTPEVIIPADTEQNRQSFKAVPGMKAFLDRQYKAMIKREELKLAHDNSGKSKGLQKSL